MANVTNSGVACACPQDPEGSLRGKAELREVTKGLAAYKLLRSRLCTVGTVLGFRWTKSTPSGISALSGFVAGTNLMGLSCAELLAYKDCRPAMRN